MRDAVEQVSMLRINQRCTKVVVQTEIKLHPPSPPANAGMPATRPQLADPKGRKWSNLRDKLVKEVA
jgi:hypothetical protein